MKSFVSVLAFFVLLFPVSVFPETFTHKFNAGWAMLSFPFTPEDDTAGEVFGEGFPHTIYRVMNSTYSAVGKDGTIQAGGSYWIYYATDTTVIFSGSALEAASMDQQLQPGWNMVSYPFNVSTSVDSFSLDGSPAIGTLTFYVYDSSTGAYTTTTNAGGWSSFWVHVSGAGTLKADNPESAGTGVVLSSDSLAAVYSSVGFYEDYTPAAPAKISSGDIPSSALGACWDSDDTTVPLEDTAYTFTFSASPPTQIIPGSGYTIAFETGRLLDTAGGYTATDTADLRCASCDSTNSQWVLREGYYATFPYMDDSPGIGCRVTGFDSFVVVLANQEATCPELAGTPGGVSPANGSEAFATEPVFVWQAVNGADTYSVTVYDENMTLVSNIPPAYGTSAQYVGADLTEGTQYQWYVTAVNDCGNQSTGSSFYFTSRSGIPPDPSLLPVPVWISAPGVEPVIPGDQLVSLNWDRIEDDDVLGYAVFRSQAPPDFATSNYIDIVYIDELDGELPDPDCPVQFSESNPGYCDTGVTNGETYYYRIASVGVVDSIGAMGATESVTLDLLPPALISPGSPGGSTIATLTPLFSWEPANGTGVQYQVTLMDAASSTLWQSAATGASLLYPGSPALATGSQYSWTVSASNGSVQSGDSDPFLFDIVDPPDLEAVKFCGGANCSPQQSSSYVVSYTDNSVTLYWEKPADDDVEGFNIYRCKDEAGTCTGAENLATTTANVSCTAMMSNVVCYKDAGLPRGSIYYYSVTMEAYGLEGVASDTVAATLELKGPIINVPVYDSVVYDPETTFQWDGENGAAYYEFQIVKAPDTLSNPANFIWSYTVSDPSEATETVSIRYNEDGQMSEPLNNLNDPEGPGYLHYCRVCSSNDRFPTPACSSVLRLYKKMETADTVAPETGAQNSTTSITFQWTEVEYAAGYNLVVCQKSGAFTDCSFSTPVYQADVQGGDVTQHVMPVTALDWCDIQNDPDCSESGAYLWQVQAYDKFGEVSGSLGNLGSDLFYNLYKVILGPDDWTELHADSSCGTTTDYYGDTSFNYEVDFSWNDFSATGSYSFKVTEVLGTTETVIYETTVSGTSLSANTDCGASGADIPFSISRTLGGITDRYYTWNVTGEGDVYHADIARRLTTVIPPPSLASPADSTTIQMVSDCDGMLSMLCVTFTWDGGGWGSTVPRAGSYDIEILKNGALPFLCQQGFVYDPNNPIDPPFTNTTNTSCDLGVDGTSIIPGDTITWRVRSRDDSGDLTDTGMGYPGNWSDARTFTVAAP